MPSAEFKPATQCTNSPGPRLKPRSYRVGNISFSHLTVSKFLETENRFVVVAVNWYFGGAGFQTSTADWLFRRVVPELLTWPDRC